MVGRVLTGNGITRYCDGLTTLIGAEELSDSERDALLQLCRQRLDGFREQRGEEVFAHRSRHRSPISGSVKYRVLTRPRGRCECCGAHEHQRALEVDHIVLKNQGGSDDFNNLQALCFRCNAGKRDTDSTDFRSVLASYGVRQEGCVFSALEGSSRVLQENELALCIADAYPVSEGHSLSIPRRHMADGMALHQPE
jgi:ATP adenylyltransferase